MPILIGLMHAFCLEHNGISLIWLCEGIISVHWSSLYGKLVKQRATGRHTRLFSLIQLCSSFFAKQNKHMPILPPQFLFFFKLIPFYREWEGRQNKEVSVCNPLSLEAHWNYLATVEFEFLKYFRVMTEGGKEERN